MSVYGHLAEFGSIGALRDAHARLVSLGYKHIDVFTPWPVAVKAAAVPRRHVVGIVMLAGFVVGTLATLGMQYYAAVYGYAVNVGGRPAASWPAFVPAALEVGMLFAGLAGLAAFLRITGLPRLYRPEFNVAWFDEASRGGFLLMVRADDPAWDEHRCAHEVGALHPLRHAAVPA